jgi:hypothetical protein
VLLARYCSSQIKENEMGGACSIHGREETYRILKGKSEGWRFVWKI